MRNLKIVVKAISEGVGLDTVFVRSFDDEYHKENEHDGDELYQEARQIRRRYRSFSEFYHAQSVFIQYMDRLIEKYGSLDMLEVSYESGAVKEFVPPIPRMRDTKTNRRIMKLGIPVSTTPTGKAHINFDAIDEIVEENKPRVSITMGKNMVDEESQRLFENVRLIRPSMGSTASMNSLEMIERYISNTKTQKKSMEERDRHDNTFTLAELYDTIDEDVVYESDSDDEFVLYRNKPISKSDHELLTLTTQLGKLGWDSTSILRSMKSGNNDRLTRVAKELRQEDRKRRKRDKKRRKADKVNESFFSELMGFDDRHTFAEYENDMVNLSMDNIFG